MNISVDDWMHASDDERTQAIQSWNIEKNDGKEIAERVATMFKGECVYKVLETRTSIKDSKWVIDAFSETDDYETLKQRKNVAFLGFDIVFNHIDDF